MIGNKWTASGKRVAGFTGLLASAWLAIPGAAGAAEAAVMPEGHWHVRGVPFTAVELQEGFWKDRLDTARRGTLPHALHQCETTGRIDNFARAAGKLGGKHVGFHFNDSDVYKIAEGLARQLALAPDPQLEQRLDSIIATIASAQQEDGYIHPFITLEEPDARWKHPHRHELFSIGHLIEAGAVHYQLSGKRGLLDVAVRAADRVEADFHPGTGPLNRPPEHQQIEIGLVQLAVATGGRKYLDLAKRILDARGRGEGRPLMGAYSQDHQPVVEQREAVGHAVRLLYQAMAMTDVAAYLGDGTYREALDALWQDVYGRKSYVTGGVGSSGGNEGFGPAYDLPNATAYSETCAAIGSILWNDRMFRLTGEVKHADLIERTLYNALLSGVAISGDRFFYPNRLESFRGAERSPWFECACCPSSVVRFMPQIPGLVYGVRGATVYVNQYLPCRVTLALDGGKVALRQETAYPWNGNVRLVVEPDAPRRFELKLRVPDWARSQTFAGGLYRRVAGPEAGTVEVKVNGTAAGVLPVDGYLTIARGWRAGDVVELAIPMPVMQVKAADEVVACDGRMALQRGPVVFCAEGIDQTDGTVGDLMLDQTAPVGTGFERRLEREVAVLHASARKVARNPVGDPVAGEMVKLTAIPYALWAHRGPTPMQVWLAVRPEAARPAPVPTLVSTGKLTSSAGGGLPAIQDQLEPRSSGDHSLPYFHWWPKAGTTEWIDCEFSREATVNSTEVYWFDDSDQGGGCRIPKAWRVLYREGAEWKPVDSREVYTTEKDRWSRVSFKPVTTTALRLEVVLPEHFATGVHEWKIGEEHRP